MAFPSVAFRGVFQHGFETVAETVLTVVVETVLELVVIVVVGRTGQVVAVGLARVVVGAGCTVPP